MLEEMQISKEFGFQFSSLNDLNKVSKGFFFIYLFLYLYRCNLWVASSVINMWI